MLLSPVSSRQAHSGPGRSTPAVEMGCHHHDSPENLRGSTQVPNPCPWRLPPPPTLILVDTRNGLPRTSMTFNCNGIRCPCRHDVATSLHEGASPRTRWMQSEAVHFSSPLWHHIPRTAALRLNTRRSGRQDSNLRSPAPKAGALATTLRPVSSRLSQREHRQLSGTPRHSANETPLQRQFRHFDTDRMASAMTSGRSNIMR